MCHKPTPFVDGGYIIPDPLKIIGTDNGEEFIIPHDKIGNIFPEDFKIYISDCKTSEDFYKKIKDDLHQAILKSQQKE